MKGKRILSAVLSAALLLQLSPLAVFAEDTSLLPVTAQTVQTEPAPEEPTPEPAGEETALPEEPAPDAAETPAPEPSAEPTAAPDPAAEVQAMIDALPDEVTEDNAEAVEQALTDIDDAKQSLTDDELAGLDFARYDAAANALLALWGEAPADAVELLDTTYEKPVLGSDNYYQITNESNLRWFAEAVNGGNSAINARLTANIKVNDKVFNDDGSLISDPKTWTPIGVSYSKAFKGTFDGAGYTISGLYCDMTDRTDIEYVGLFGRINGGTVTNLGVLDSYFAGNSLVGGVCGKNDGGTIEECYNTGKVTGTSSVGGVCGENYHDSDSSSIDSTVVGCYNEGEVTGTWTVGGVCGNNYGGTVKGCHNTKAVNGSSTVGGVCGQNARNGTVEGCHNEGNVTGTADDGQQVGGVCGYIESGTVKECHNDGTVTGTMIVGGVCGQNGTNGTLQKCYNTNTVSGTNYVGGVCGTQVKGTVQECYNTGKVTGAITGEFGCIGGVCGWNSNGILEKSYNTHTVSGTKFVGGVCGKNNNTVNGCYNTGTVTGTGESIGGVCGQNKNTVNGCYNTGDVSGEGSKVGGVCGENTGKVGNCYYLAGTSANAVGNGTVGTNCASKTKLQFQNGDVAFQMQADLGETATQVWGQTLGTNASPVLAWQTEDCKQVYRPTSGTSPCTGGYNNTGDGALAHKYENSACIYCGEPEPPAFDNGYYQITNEAQLYWFAKKVRDGETGISARLMADITINSGVLTNGELNTSASANFTPWTPIGTSSQPFTGTFDGNNKTISGLYFNDSAKDYVGLFGHVGAGDTVKKVTLADSYVSGKDYVGGICGHNNGGTLQNCHTTGTVSGSNNVGGVCSYIYSGTVENCYNTGSVSGAGNSVGGVCGCIVRGKITGCTNSDTVSVSGYRFLGGIVGYANNTTVQDCGNTGAVTRTNNNEYCGGIAGSTDSTSSIQNCYNAYRTIVYPICASPSQETTLLNCYYLADSSGTDPTAKTAEQFASGEVAYLLQGNRAEPVWGQKIGTDTYPKLGGDKVYQSAPCTADYSNTEIPPKQHVIGNDGKCTDCGELCIAYTVTIPATVELGTTAIIKAKDVILPNGKTLNVKVAEGSEFKVAQVDDNDAVVDKCAYTVTKGETKTPVNPSDTVLTAVNGESEKTVELQFNKPESTTYSGTYTGTVTFTVGEQFVKTIS